MQYCILGMFLKLAQCSSLYSVPRLILFRYVIILTCAPGPVPQLQQPLHNKEPGYNDQNPAQQAYTLLQQLGLVANKHKPRKHIHQTFFPYAMQCYPANRMTSKRSCLFPAQRYQIVMKHVQFFNWTFESFIAL